MQLRFRGTVCTAGQVRYGAVEPDVTILTKSVSGVTTFPLTRHADEVRFRSTARWSAANHRSPWFHVNNATTSTAAAVRFRRAGLPRNSRSGIESLSERSSRKMVAGLDDIQVATNVTALGSGAVVKTPACHVGFSCEAASVYPPTDTDSRASLRSTQTAWRGRCFDALFSTKGNVNGIEKS